MSSDSALDRRYFSLGMINNGSANLMIWYRGKVEQHAADGIADSKKRACTLVSRRARMTGFPGRLEVSLGSGPLIAAFANGRREIDAISQGCVDLPFVGPPLWERDLAIACCPATKALS